MNTHARLALLSCGVLLLLALAAVAGSISGERIVAKPGVKKSVQSPSKQRSLTILYTSQARGQIRSCNCTKFRYGGYGREATLVAKLRKEVPGSVLIEGGDMTGRLESEQSRLKADVAMDAMGMMNYAAIVPGECEILARLPKLQNLKKRSKVGFVLANVTDRKSGQAVCNKPYIIHKLPDGYRIGIIGVLGPGLLSRIPLGSREVDVEDPLEAVKRLLPKVRKEADFVVVVSHSTLYEAKGIAQAGKVDVVLLTHPEDDAHMPAEGQNVVDLPGEMIGGCVFVESGSRTGWSVGRLDIKLDGRKIVASTNKLLYLDRAYDEDPAVVKLFDDYSKQVAEMALRQGQELKDQVQATLAKRGYTPTKRKSGFIGAEGCKSCHQATHETWTKSRHARALASLEKTNQHLDPECISCHTTGAGHRGAFVNANATPEFANVQCESCHGPGRAHAESPAKGYGRFGEDGCRTCHTDQYNPDFDYDAMWKPIEH